VTLRNGRKQRLYTRSGEDWKHYLESLGLQVEARSMKKGIGFCNVLLTAIKPPCTETS
jgi:hypothetical protein